MLERRKHPKRAVLQGDTASRMAPRLAWVALAIATVAALWRAHYLVRLWSTPLAGHLEMDSRIYWEWSAQLLRDGWVGTHQFFMAPLYPYALALVRLVTADSIGAIQVLQGATSALAIGLLAWLVARLHGFRWGIALGLLLAGNGPWIFMDGQVLMEPLLLALQVVLLWILVVQGDRPASLRSAALLGLVIGLMAQARATALVLVIPVGAWELRRAGPRRGLQTALALAAALALTAAPTALRSYQVGREFIPFTYGGGYNFYVGNGAVATGGFVHLPEVDREPQDRSFEGGAVGDGRNILLARHGKLPSPSRSSGLWMEQAWSEIAGDPARWARLIVRKAHLLVRSEEVSQIQSLRAYATLAGPLGWPLLGGFGVLGVLGLLGMLEALRGRGIYRLFAAMWATLALAAVVFFVIDRYRVHLVPTSALLAPLALRGLATSFAHGHRLKFAGAVLGVLVAVALVFWPVVGSSPAKVQFDIATTLASAYLQAGRASEAAGELQKAIAIDREHALPDGNTSSGRLARADAYRMHAFLAMDEGEWSAAARDFGRAGEIDPASRAYALHEALALAAEGDEGTASELLEANGIDRARARDELLRRLKESEARGNAKAMGGYLRALNAILPHWEPGVIAWTRFLMQQGLTGEAQALLASERQAGLRTELADVHLAAILKMEGRERGARRLLAQIPERVRVEDPVVGATIRTYQLDTKQRASPLRPH